MRSAWQRPWYLRASGLLIETALTVVAGIAGGIFIAVTVLFVVCAVVRVAKGGG